MNSNKSSKFKSFLLDISYNEIETLLDINSIKLVNLAPIIKLLEDNDKAIKYLHEIV